MAINTANEKIRQIMKEKNVPQWLLADALGKCENTVQRMLRKELSGEEQTRIIAMINIIAANKGGR